jgi:hypothetical protein
MTYVEPGKGRAIIGKTGAGLRVTVPAFQPARVLKFAVFSAIGLYIVVDWSISLVSRDPPAALVSWTIFAVVLLAAAYTFVTSLWDLVGREIIEIDDTLLRQRIEKPFLHRTRDYRVVDISRLRPAPAAHQGRGTILFDQDGSAQEIAVGLDVADARYVVGEMHKQIGTLGAAESHRQDEDAPPAVETDVRRIGITRDGTVLRIVIPARRAAIPMLIGLVGITLWLFTLMTSLYRLVMEPWSAVPYQLFTLAVWTAIGLWLASVVLWTLAGKEIIELDTTKLKRRLQMPFFCRSRNYAAAHMANLKVAAQDGQGSFWKDMSFLTLDGSGTVLFDYGRDDLRLGVDLDRAEAEHVVNELRKGAKLSDES